MNALTSELVVIISLLVQTGPTRASSWNVHGLCRWMAEVVENTGSLLTHESVEVVEPRNQLCDH